MRKQLLTYVPCLIFTDSNNKKHTLICKDGHFYLPTLPSYEEFINTISKNLGFSVKDTIQILCSLLKTVPASFFNIVLMVLAKHFDASYEDHISKASKIFVFSTVDAKIHELDGNSIKKIAFKHFAAFRTKEEAIQAIKYMYALKTYLLNGGK